MSLARRPDLPEPLQHRDADALALLEAGKEAADGMLLPAGDLHNLGDGGALVAAQERQDCLLLRALARRA